MAVNGVTVMSEGQRWTGRRKAEVVLEIIKGNITIVDFCRSNDLKQSEVEKWVEDFLQAGTQGLKTNPKDLKAQHRKEIEEMQKVVGEQALTIRVLKKSIELQEQDENES